MLTSSTVIALSSFSIASLSLVSSSVALNLFILASTKAASNSFASAVAAFMPLASVALSTFELKLFFCASLRSNLFISSFAASFAAFNS